MVAEPKRRTLDFHTADEIIADINHLRESGYCKTAKWNLTQVCQHLTGTMNGGMDGFGWRLPWILRATVVKWAFQRGLNKRSLPSGAPTFKSLRPPKADGGQDDDAAIDECISTLRRAADFPGPLIDYALLDNVDTEDWRQFMWIHASHHLGFLVPKELAVQPTPSLNVAAAAG